MSYAARVIQASVPSFGGPTLYTVEVRFPRFILAEYNTHRDFARNSASSRAIPPEKHIENLHQNGPFIPEVFRKRVKGMGQGEALEDQGAAKQTWISAFEAAIDHAEVLCEMEISKSHVNRLLEPFLWHTALVTSTEWENFFALRCPPGNEVDYDFPAQPEFQRSAILLRQAMRDFEPQELYNGPGRDVEWHLPFVRPEEVGDEMACGISAGRCATISYEKPEVEWEPAPAAIERSEKLGTAGHMSPFEHPARPFTTDEWAQVRAMQRIVDETMRPWIPAYFVDAMRDRLEFCGNLRGWVPYRKMIPFEANRVGHLEDRKSWRYT